MKMKKAIVASILTLLSVSMLGMAYNWTSTSVYTSPGESVFDQSRGVSQEFSMSSSSSGTNVLTLRPDSDGTFTEWNAEGAIENWDCVDEEIKDDDETYVYANAPIENDSYSLQNTAQQGLILKVEVCVYARQTVGDEELRLMLWVDGAMYSGLTYSPSYADYTRYTSEWPKNPATGSAWEWSEINALEAGITSWQYGPNWIGQIRVTQLYVHVTFIPAICIRPDSDGTFTEWNAEGAIENWDCVDEEIKDDDETYVNTSVTERADSYSLQNTAQQGLILKVEVCVYARQTVGNEELRLMLVVDGVKHYGLAYVPSLMDYTLYTSEWLSNPVTGSLWKWSEINALEGGIESRQSGGEWTGEMNVTQLYVCVTFIPPICVAGSQNGYVYAFSLEGGSPLWTYYVDAPMYTDSHGQTVGVASVAMSARSEYVAAGLYKTKLVLLDGSTGTLLWEKSVSISESYDSGWTGAESKSVAISADGAYIVAAATDGLYVYKNDGTLLWSNTTRSFTCIDISPDGKWIAACEYWGAGDDVYFFSIASNKPVWTKDIDAYWVATSNRGDVFASGDTDVDNEADTVYLLSKIGGTEIWSYTLDRTGYVRVDMSSNGLNMTAVNDDPSDSLGSRLWSFDVTGLKGTFTPDPDVVGNDFHSVAISPNGTIIATGPAYGANVTVLSSDCAVLQTIADGCVQSISLTYNGTFGVAGDRFGRVWMFSKDADARLWHYTISPPSYVRGGREVIIHSVAIFQEALPLESLEMAPYHDVGITNVTPDENSVYKGDSISIDVTVENHGDFSETFGVTVYRYKDYKEKIGTESTTLEAGGSETLTFTWITVCMDLGTYSISAEATAVSGEFDIVDNKFSDGTITVQPNPLVVYGPVMNRKIFKVIKSPDAQVKAMKLGEIDMYPGLMRPGDAEELADWGATLLSTPGFHFSYIGTNIRAWDWDSDTIPEAGWPAPYDCAGDPVSGYDPDVAEAKRCLLDVQFRLAVAHLIPKEEIIGTIFKYIVVRSDTPCSPALGRFWQETPRYQFDPDQATQILLDAGYYADETQWYYDAAMTEPLGEIKVASPTYEEAPTSFTIVKMMIEEMHKIGLGNMKHDPQSFPYPLVWNTLYYHEFDMYFLSWGLTRFPDHFYSFFHSDNDRCYGYNTPGVNDPTINNLAKIIKTSLSLTEVIEAAKEIQLELIDVTRGNPAALCYIPVYSRNYFDAYEPDLAGMVNVLGYGSDNGWTAANMRWTDGSPAEFRYVIGTEPFSFNPLWSSAPDEIACWGPVFDGLISTDPYRNDDVAWEATDWSWAEYIGNSPGGKFVGDVANPGMKISYTIREGEWWHSGKAFTASDAKFSWDYIAQWQPSGYLDVWNWYVESVVSTAPVGGLHAGIVDVYVNTTSLWLVYDYAETASRLDPDVWSEVKPGGTVFNGIPRNFEPSDYDHPNDVTITDPQDATTFKLTCMSGTGNWIWKDYDEVSLKCKLVANRNHWFSQDDLCTFLKMQLYWAGDLTKDGVVDGQDVSIPGAAFGSEPGDWRWDVRADIAPRHPYRADIHPVDEFIDIEDLYVVGASIGMKKEYP